MPDKLLTYQSRFPVLMHTSAHIYQFPFSFWASALDHYMVSALKSRSRLDLCPQ